jgi:hypothetical protein
MNLEQNDYDEYFKSINQYIQQLLLAIQVQARQMQL